MSYGTRQFLMTDPGGTSIRVGPRISEDQSLRPVPAGPARRSPWRAARLRLTGAEREAARDALARLAEPRE